MRSVCQPSCQEVRSTLYSAFSTSQSGVLGCYLEQYVIWSSNNTLQGLCIRKVVHLEPGPLLLLAAAVGDQPLLITRQRQKLLVVSYPQWFELFPGSELPLPRQQVC